MSTYDVGDRARLYLSLTDINDAPANGTVVLTVTRPDLTTSTPTVVNDSTGQYHADVDVDAEGRWTYRWVSTGAVIASESGVLEVRASAPLGIVSLDDAKAHLNVTTADEDDELRIYIDAATQWVEAKVGVVVRRTITETLRPTRSGTLVLNNSPVVSLTTIAATEGWSYSYDVANVFLDATYGEVRLGLSSYTWAYPLTVTYVAGRTIVPPGVRLACLMYLKALWETQRGSTDLPIQGFSDEVDAGDGMGLAIWRAEKLLEPYLLPPAIA